MLNIMQKNTNLALIDLILPLSGNKILVFAKDLFLVLSFAVLTGLSAQLKIEIGVVPITGQTLMVLLSGVFLGAVRGGLSQLTYLFGGLLGIPWFSRLGGWQYIFSPTFGYIIGFVFAAVVVGLLCEKMFWDRKIESLFIVMLVGEFFIYFFGLIYLNFFIIHSFSKTLVVGFLPFILGDFLKILLALVLIPSLRKFFEKT